MKLAVLLLFLLTGCAATPCDQARMSDTGIGFMFEETFCKG